MGYWRWEAAVQGFADAQTRRWLSLASFLRGKGLSLSASAPELELETSPEASQREAEKQLSFALFPPSGVTEALSGVLRWKSIQGLASLGWTLVTLSIFLTPMSAAVAAALLFPGLVRPVLCTWVCAEGVFFVLRAVEWKRVSSDVVLQAVPSREEVAQLLDRILSLRCMGVVQPQEFLSGWFLGAPFQSLSRDHVKEFLAFGLYHRDLAELSPELQVAVEEDLSRLEEKWGVTLGAGPMSPRRGALARRSTCTDLTSAASLAAAQEQDQRESASLAAAVKEAVHGAQQQQQQQQQERVQKEKLPFMRHTREPLRALLHPLALYAWGHTVGALTALAMRLMGFERKKCKSTGLRYYIKRHSPTYGINRLEREQSLEHKIPLDGPCLGDEAEQAASASLIPSLGVTSPVSSPTGRPQGHVFEKASTDEDKEEACVFVHGLGVGLTPYLAFVSQLLGASRSRHRALAVVELPHLAFRLCTCVPTVEELVAGLDEVVEDCTEGSGAKASFVGHSYGSLVLAQYVRTRPTRVASLGLIDPVCILLCLPFTIYNFVYKVPDFESVKGTLADSIRLLMCSRELNVARALCRNFNWHDLHLWAHQMPQRTAVMLAGQDRIVPAQRVKKYLEAHSIPFIYNDSMSHAQFLFRPEVQRSFLGLLYPSN